MPSTLFANVSATGQSMIMGAQALLPQTAPMINLVSKKEISKGHTQADMPYVTSTATVQTPDEGDDIEYSDVFTISSISIVPGIKVMKYKISKRAERFSKEDLTALVRDEMATSQGQNIDELLLAQFPNFHTDNDSGSGGADMTFATARTAQRRIRATTRANGGPPIGQQISLVLSPIGMEDFLTSLGAQGVVATATATGQQFVPSGLSQDIMKQYAIPGGELLGGIGIYWDGYLQGDFVGIPSAGDVNAGMFAKKALWYVYSQEWEHDVFETDTWLGVILRADADYGVGVGPISRWGAQIIIDDA